MPAILFGKKMLSTSHDNIIFLNIHLINIGHLVLKHHIKTSCGSKFESSVVFKSATNNKYHFKIVSPCHLTVSFIIDMGYIASGKSCVL